MEPTKDIAEQAVLQPSAPLPEFTEQVKGYDWSQGINYNALLDSYRHTGFQATNFGLAIEEINAMVSKYLANFGDTIIVLMQYPSFAR